MATTQDRTERDSSTPLASDAFPCHNGSMLRDAWDVHAQDWFSWAREPGHDSYWRFHRDAFLPLIPAPGRLTLDIGCGEGRVGRDLEQRGHRVMGLDASPMMTRAAVTHPDARAPCVVADAAVLPLHHGVADCAVAFMSLQNVDAVEAAVAEVARVLVSGGRLVMAITHPVNTAGHFVPGFDDTFLFETSAHLHGRAGRSGVSHRTDPRGGRHQCPQQVESAPAISPSARRAYLTCRRGPPRSSELQPVRASAQQGSGQASSARSAGSPWAPHCTVMPSPRIMTTNCLIDR
jgi:SAM-dependent methyltransferase